MNAILKRFVESITKIPLAVNLLRTLFASSYLNDSHLYGSLCNIMAKRYNASRPYGNLRINIETTLACNAKCIMCSKRSYPLQSGTMSDEIYVKTIKDAIEIGVRKVILSVYGEPLMDRKFVQRAKLAAESGLRFSFYTNASLLKKEISSGLLRTSNFSSVNFSINGFSKQTYNKIMVGLDRDTTYENVLGFLEIKNKLKSNVFVGISCVLFERNKHEMREFRKFWKSQRGVDRVYFPIIRDRGGTQLDVEACGHNVSFSPLSAKSHKLLPCKFLWEDLFIYWNGDVGVCCEDTAARRIVIGNVRQTALKHIWLGETMRDLRELHLDGKRQFHKVCGKACKYNAIWLKP